MILRLKASALLAVLMLPVLGGCVSIGAGGEPPEQLVTFTARETPVAGTASSGEVRDAIVVFEPEVEDRLDVNRVPVKVDATGVAYLQEAIYVDRPARLFQHLLAETLRARKGGLVIEGEDPGVLVSTRIYGRLMEAGYDAQAASVSVVYDAVAVAPDGTMRQRRFGQTVTGIAPEAAAVAPALNDAANDVAADVASWLTGKAG